MSRIGKKPIEIPEKVRISQDGATVKVEGPKGTLSMQMPAGVDVAIDQGSVEVKRSSNNRTDRSYHGLVRTLVANMVTGVSTGFEKGLEISGVGYRAETNSDVLKLVLGYSDPWNTVSLKGSAYGWTNRSISLCPV